MNEQEQMLFMAQKDTPWKELFNIKEAPERKLEPTCPCPAFAIATGAFMWLGMLLFLLILFT